ncbi:SseB family protein [Microbacterium sp.]|uniref:SseB family protein n=1 Tax=Microbacterium sp. TaxID=51671 RepID=UPI0025F02973|nr:SseB family protein [Microbacterium sp.]
MALFNRRPRRESAAPGHIASESSAAVREPVLSGEALPGEVRPSEVRPDAVPDEYVPEVGISVSTFGRTPTRPPRAVAETPLSSEVVPGLVDNAVLKGALDALPEKPENLDVMNVMRQMLQGQLYVRVRGDARSLLAAGEPLTLAVSTIGENRFLLAFSGGAALQASIRADGDGATSAVRQPSVSILRNTLAGPYAGLILDHAVMGSRIVLPTPLIQKALDEADPDLTLKTLLSAPRQEAMEFEVVDALTRVRLWVAGATSEDGTRLGLAEARTADGQRRLEVFSHPLEVLAMRRGDRPLPLTAVQLGKSLAADAALSGVVIDPGGPWIALDRDQLAPVLALAG